MYVAARVLQYRCRCIDGVVYTLFCIQCYTDAVVNMVLYNCCCIDGRVYMLCINVVYMVLRNWCCINSVV